MGTSILRIIGHIPDLEDQAATIERQKAFADIDLGQAGTRGVAARSRSTADKAWLEDAGEVVAAVDDGGLDKGEVNAERKQFEPRRDFSTIAVDSKVIREMLVD